MVIGEAGATWMYVGGSGMEGEERVRARAFRTHGHANERERKIQTQRRDVRT